MKSEQPYTRKVKPIEWERQGECMVCTSHAKNNGGYPVIVRNRKLHLISRMVLERRHGPLGKLHAMHSCDNPACINPSHLRAGTHQDNMEDALQKGRLKFPKTNKGEDHHSAKLNPEKVRFIRQSKLGKRKLAAMFGVTHRAIQQVKLKISWKEVA